MNHDAIIFMCGVCLGLVGAILAAHDVVFDRGFKAGTQAARMECESRLKQFLDDFKVYNFED